jgi:protein-disulfide isomerase-like protein with CxxC motif
MNPELYFIYDSHCPWSYASSTLVDALAQAYPEIIIHVWHCAHYDGSDCAGYLQVDMVAKQSNVKFGQEHLRFADSPKDSIMTANFMAWLQNKQSDKVLPVLNALQKEHFKEGNAFTCKHDFGLIIEQFKLSPPNKVFKDELSSEAEYILADIAELQEFIGTTGFPALLLTQGDKAVLLDHSLYLKKPDAMVKAVKKELA